MLRWLGVRPSATDRQKDPKLMMIQVKSQAIASLGSKGKWSGCGDKGRMIYLEASASEEL